MIKAMVWLLVATAGSTQLAHAADSAGGKPPERWAGSVQVEASRGGDDLYNDEVQSSTESIGDGVGLNMGLIYRPFERSAFELQGWIGYKFDWIQGVFGDDVGFSRNVVQLLGNYRNRDKWYAGGGLVLHLHPEFEDQLYGFTEELEFDDAAGVTIQGGWNWVGLQCTWIEYKSPNYGKFDASNCGVQFTFRFPRWRPVD